MSFTGTIEYLEAPDFLLLELFSEVENKFASSKSTKCKKNLPLTTCMVVHVLPNLG